MDYRKTTHRARVWETAIIWDLCFGDLGLTKDGWMDGITQPKASITSLRYSLFVPGFRQTINNKEGLWDAWRGKDRENGHR
jgi:hypothetical protein